MARVMVFNATFNNISVISWRSVLLVKEGNQSTRRKSPTFRQSLANFIAQCVSSRPRHPSLGFELTTLVVIGTDYIA